MLLIGKNQDTYFHNPLLSPKTQSLQAADWWPTPTFFDLLLIIYFFNHTQAVAARRRQAVSVLGIQQEG